MRVLATLCLSLAVACLAPPPASAQQPPRMQTLKIGPVEMAVPPGWVAESQSVGAQSVRDPAADGWSLEVGADAIDMAPGRPQPDQVTRMAENAKVKLLAQKGGTVTVRDGARGEKIVVHDFWAPGAGQGRWVRSWQRIAIRDNSIVVADFTFLANREAADRPEIVAARDLVERQALTAELRAR